MVLAALGGEMPDPEPDQKPDPSPLCERCQSAMVWSQSRLMDDRRIENTYICEKCGSVSRLETTASPQLRMSGKCAPFLRRFAEDPLSFRVFSLFGFLFAFVRLGAEHVGSGHGLARC